MPQCHSYLRRVGDILSGGDASPGCLRGAADTPVVACVSSCVPCVAKVVCKVARSLGGKRDASYAGAWMPDAPREWTVSDVHARFAHESIGSASETVARGARATLPQQGCLPAML